MGSFELSGVQTIAASNSLIFRSLMSLKSASLLNGSMLAK